MRFFSSTLALAARGSSSQEEVPNGTELLSYCRTFSCAIVGLMEAFHLRLADSFGTWNWSDAVAALCVLSHGVPWFRRQHG